MRSVIDPKLKLALTVRYIASFIKIKLFFRTHVYEVFIDFIYILLISDFMFYIDFYLASSFSV